MPRKRANRRDVAIAQISGRQHGVITIELDGWRSHGTPSAFEADRDRDTRLKLVGYDVVPFTWRQVEGRPREVARTVRTLLNP